jgi:hypothetical protein
MVLFKRIVILRAKCFTHFARHAIEGNLMGIPAVKRRGFSY